MTTLTVDDLHLELKRSARRKTVQITVDRDGQLIVMAPPEVPEESLCAFVREKKLAQHAFRSVQPPRTQRDLRPFDFALRALK